jgi:Malectin domain
LQSAVSKLEAERAEVDDILSSGVFGRGNNNLVRLLGFVCEKYFEGALDEIKEYSIAIHALGRPESFDPQLDTVVRVTAHGLRKRLDDYYRGPGAEHRVHICLPPGHYIPKFIHMTELNGAMTECRPVGGHNGQSPDGPPANGNGQSEHQPESAARAQEQHPKIDQTKRTVASGPWFRLAATVFVVAVVVLSGYVLEKRGARSDSGNPRPFRPTVSNSTGAGTVRAMVGYSSVPYVGHDGFNWDADDFCSGGTPFSVTGHAIQGTEDPLLFSSGRRGLFHCRFPVSPGTYELHLLFAETSGLQENSRNVGFSINSGPISTLDVVDDAGGDDIATTKVFTDVAPQNDGTIHLDFTTPDAFVNAVEIVPGTPHRMLPIRILAGHTPYRDSNGNFWMSDRYFFGGRLSTFGGDLSKLPSGIYQGHRFGHFRYVLPVVAHGKYTVKLYFMEHWFGAQNGGVGGAGSRVFDVYCNGSTLLKGFDIFREGGSNPVVKTFQHIEPTPEGKIEIEFIPNVNYPSVSAIEIIPE